MPKISPKEQTLSSLPTLLDFCTYQWQQCWLLLTWWAQVSTSLVTQLAAASLCWDTRHFLFYLHKIKCQPWTSGTLRHQNSTPPWTGLNSTECFSHIRRQFIFTQSLTIKDDANTWLLQFELNYLQKPELNGLIFTACQLEGMARFLLQLCLRWGAWTAKIN